jgi:hypothetical protein
MKAVNVEAGEHINVGITFDVTNKWFDEQDEKVQLGYMSTNIIKPLEGAGWGRFNDRAVKEAWVQHLASEFVNNKQNCRKNTAISIAVKKSWIKNVDEIMPSVAGKDIEEVPMLELTDEAKNLIRASEEDEIWFLSGNHRRLALKIHISRLGKEKEAILKEAEKMHKKQIEGGHNHDQNAEEKEFKAQAEKLGRDIETASRWAVLVYDRGERPCDVNASSFAYLEAGR